MGDSQPSRTKRQRFLEVAERRTRRTLRTLRLLGNCANRSAYEFTEKDVQLILDAIESELGVLRAKFRRGTRSEVEFKLDR